MDFHEFIERYPIQLNEQQKAAVQTIDGPVLLLAVPGSGKTTVLTARLGYMVLCCGIRPENILTVTYTRASTKDMKERAKAMFGEELAERIEYRTINGICYKILQYFNKYIKHLSLTLADEKQIMGILTGIFQSVEHKYPDENELSTVRTLITYAKNMMLDDKELQELNKDIECDFRTIYTTYHKVMKEKGLMDYDDQMVYSYHILNQYPEVLSFYQNQYRYICVDESQDTSKIQHMIIALLAKKNRNLFMVGDEDQSIYAFRAAYPQALLDFEKNYKDAKVLLMEQNYRSNANIVKAADSFIQKNTLRHKKTMQATKDAASEVKEIKVRDRGEQFDMLYKVARDCTDQTAVLFRNNESSIPLIDILEREHIPYRIRNVEISFFTHKIVKDVTSIIRLAYDNRDIEAFMNLYYKLGLYIKKEDAQTVCKVVRYSKAKDIFGVIELSSLSESVRKNVADLKKRLDRLKTAKGANIMNIILYDIGYDDYIKAQKIKDTKTFILRDISSRVGSPAEFVNRLKELKDIIETKESDYSCPFILSTIHSSKGLEYNNVYLIDVEDGIFPEKIVGPYAKDKELSEYEEERRLFYVGVTRAKNNLYIVNNGARSLFRSEILRKEKAKKKEDAPDKKVKKAKKMEVSEEDITYFLRVFPDGRNIIHKKFGAGTIISAGEEYTSIAFFEYADKQDEIKTFSTKKLIEKGLIKPVK